MHFVHIFLIINLSKVFVTCLMIFGFFLLHRVKLTSQQVFDSKDKQFFLEKKIVIEICLIKMLLANYGLPKFEIRAISRENVCTET